MIKNHFLKTWPKYFQATKDGTKTFEIRKFDRDYEVGDHLILQEYDRWLETYTGANITCEVTYVLKGGRFGVSNEYCVMGIRRLLND